MRQLEEYKDVVRATWATGDYDAMMRQEQLYEVGVRLVDHVQVQPGEAILDVATGTGNAAIPAARAGGRVTGLDLTPEMLEVARRRAREAGVEVDWRQGDAEALPFEDAHFDVVLSTFGCMFAPRHEIVADEIARVLRPDGRIGLCTWAPEGTIGDFFETVLAHVPPDPDFVDPPLAWGEVSHVRELFEGTGIDLEFIHEQWTVSHPSVASAVECYTTNLGPVARARAYLEAEGRWPELRDDMTRLFERLDTSGGSGLTFPEDYLVVVGRAA